MTQLNTIEAQLQETPDKQISLTDPDVRSKAISGRGSGMVGYNVQTAVDTKNHLIVAHEVTNVGHDRNQLANMAAQAMECNHLNVVADRGYFSGEQIRECDQAGVTPFVPKPMTSGAKAEGRFGKEDFIFNAKHNEYIFPAGERLIWRFDATEKNLKLSCYWNSSCKSCALKSQCTPSGNRLIKRWNHEGVIDAMHIRLELQPEMMRVRLQTVEHSFGTLKSWMGYTHFLTKTLPRVSTEISLHILAYNIKRVIKLMGTTALLVAMMA